VGILTEPECGGPAANVYNDEDDINETNVIIVGYER
jgi:hypothetical protein